MLVEEALGQCLDLPIQELLLDLHLDEDRLDGRHGLTRRFRDLVGRVALLLHRGVKVLVRLGIDLEPIMRVQVHRALA